MIYLVTPTGDRPEALRMLRRYIDSQTYQGKMHWIVADDGVTETLMPANRNPYVTREVIRPERTWSGQNTQAKNLLAALSKTSTSKPVLVLEDDDVYLPGHVKNLVGALSTCDLVGERVSRYYNIATERYGELPGTHHASLASTGVQGDATRRLVALCMSGGTMLDVKLWRGHQGPKKLLDTHNVIGIKGMPGRRGIGVGHRETFGKSDNSGVLKEWVGEELAKEYRLMGEAT